MKIQMEKEERHMNRVVRKSIGIVTQVSNQFVETEGGTKRLLQVQNRTQTIHMNMEIRVYEYGRGGKCEYMFRYTYARLFFFFLPPHS